jgi:hypothetical protein
MKNQHESSTPGRIDAEQDEGRDEIRDAERDEEQDMEIGKLMAFLTPNGAYGKEKADIFIASMAQIIRAEIGPNWINGYNPSGRNWDSVLGEHERLVSRIFRSPNPPNLNNVNNDQEECEIRKGRRRRSEVAKKRKSERENEKEHANNRELKS